MPNMRETLKAMANLTPTQVAALTVRARILALRLLNSESERTFEAVRQHVAEKPRRLLVLDDAGREVVGQILATRNSLVFAPVPEIPLTLTQLERIIRQMREDMA